MKWIIKIIATALLIPAGLFVGLLSGWSFWVFVIVMALENILCIAIWWR